VNYRHQFHAGNFADVLKHALLVRLARALQRKPGGLLLLDTHAGRGGHDLTVAARGDTLPRAPEWPDGVGRLWAHGDLPPELAEYLALVDKFDRERGGAAGVDEAGSRVPAPPDTGKMSVLRQAPHFYPGSPWLLRELARPQDRLALCELHPEEFAALRTELAIGRGVAAQMLDGYTAIRALLPPPERRALVFIDPPFEAQDEFAQVAAALGEGLRRLPGGTFAVWYPLTARARTEEFFARLGTMGLPPAFTAEITIHPTAEKMRGCGLLVVNPPWQFDAEARALAGWLAGALAQSPGGGATLRWIVPER
jgi:23S rRNA (adenine2030-N6)-methyltransferase